MHTRVRHGQEIRARRSPTHTTLLTTMTTPLATMMTPIAGPLMGTFRHVDNIGVNTSTTVAAGVIGAVSVIEFWTHPPTDAVLQLHPFAVWNRLVVGVIPGAGIFGRAVTMHVGWGSEAMNAPTTMTEFVKLEGYRVHTYGGAGDPGEADRTLTAPFNSCRSDSLKMRNFPVGGRIKFYYFFQESNFGAAQVNGDRFILNISGEFSVYGMN